MNCELFTSLCRHIPKELPQLLEVFHPLPNVDNRNKELGLVILLNCRAISISFVHCLHFHSNRKVFCEIPKIGRMDTNSVHHTP